MRLLPVGLACCGGLRGGSGRGRLWLLWLAFIGFLVSRACVPRPREGGAPVVAGIGDMCIFRGPSLASVDIGPWLNWCIIRFVSAGVSMQVLYFFALSGA